MGDTIASRHVSSYTTFSGIDVSAMFDNLLIASLSGIASSLTREKVPIFTFGSANARSISRGKRTCAGSLQFVLFDRDPFYSLYLDSSHFYYAHADEANYYTNPINVGAFIGSYYTPNLATGDTGLRDSGGATDTLGGAIATRFDATNVNKNGANNASGVYYSVGGGTPENGQVGALSVRRAPQHADQVYPFDITIAAQNEYGRASQSAVIGVEVINEGNGISTDDISNEIQMTFIAIDRTPWVPITVGENAEETLLGRITSIVSNQNLGSPNPTFNQQREPSP